MERASIAQEQASTIRTEVEGAFREQAAAAQAWSQEETVRLLSDVETVLRDKLDSVRKAMDAVANEFIQLLEGEAVNKRETAVQQHQTGVGHLKAEIEQMKSQAELP